VNASLDDVISSLTAAAVVGLIAWVWALWRDHTALDKRVAEFYPKRTELVEAQIQTNLRLARIEELVARLCLKLEVPAVRGEW